MRYFRNAFSRVLDQVVRRQRPSTSDYEESKQKKRPLISDQDNDVFSAISTIFVDYITLFSLLQCKFCPHVSMCITCKYTYVYAWRRIPDKKSSTGNWLFR